MKNEVRDLALKAGLPSAKRKKTVRHLFLGQNQLQRLHLRRFLGEKEGPIIELETGKKIGTTAATGSTPSGNAKDWD